MVDRCPWPSNDLLMIQYHDNEWGVPVFDDDKLFEYMVLDAFQAGLSWKTILHKRENFRIAFDNFNPKLIAEYDDNKMAELLLDSGIIRNKQKISATINNAKQFLIIQKEFGTFSRYIWQFTNYKTVVNNWTDEKEIPAKTELSDSMSRDLIKRGFKFVGTTICYAFMQASGMINDHLITCPLHKKIKKLTEKPYKFD